MVDVEKQLFSIFSEFIRDLSKTYPEIKSCLYRNYEDCILNEDRPLRDFPKLQEFLSRTSEYETMITDKNLEFFDLDVDFLEEISFKRLWLKNISNKTRESIWKYLQTFQIININLKSSEQLKTAMKQIGQGSHMDLDKETTDELSKLKKLSDGVTGLDDQGSQDGLGDQGLDEMLGGLMDTGIGDIAKEVAKNMDIEKMFGDIDENADPMTLMAQMMDPSKMGQIFQNINSVMEQKMESGELSKDDLKGEAEGMMGKMSENPLFKNMMQGMGPAMAQHGQQGQQQGQQQGRAQGREQEQSKPTKEENRARLRAKIAEKKNER